MTTKNNLPQGSGSNAPRSVQRLVRWLTVAAWATLIVGLGLSLIQIGHFSEKNVTLMVGIGFLVGSVHIYVIRTAIHLVHSHSPSLLRE